MPIPVILPALMLVMKTITHYDKYTSADYEDIFDELCKFKSLSCITRLHLTIMPKNIDFHYDKRDIDFFSGKDDEDDVQQSGEEEEEDNRKEDKDKMEEEEQEQEEEENKEEEEE